MFATASGNTTYSSASKRNPSKEYAKGTREVAVRSSYGTSVSHRCMCPTSTPSTDLRQMPMYEHSSPSRRVAW